MPRSVAEPLVLLVAPLAPHMAEELWSRLGHAESLAWHPFPVADERWLVEDTVEVAVQVNGKVRAQVTVPADADAAVLEAAARADEKIAATWTGRPCAASSPSPAGWSTSSSADRPSAPTTVRRARAQHFGTEIAAVRTGLAGADAQELVPVAWPPQSGRLCHSRAVWWPSVRGCRRRP